MRDPEIYHWYDPGTGMYRIFECDEETRSSGHLRHLANAKPHELDKWYAAHHYEQACRLPLEA